MDDFLQSAAETVHKLAADPESRLHAILVGILVALTSLVAFRKRRNRTRIHVDAPQGEGVEIKVGKHESGER